MQCRPLVVWLVLIAVAEGLIRHPPDSSVAVFCWQNEAVLSAPGCDLRLLGVVAGAEYHLSLEISDGTTNVREHHVVKIAPGESRYGQKVLFPAGWEGQVTVSCDVYDAFPGLEEDDAFITRLTKIITLPSSSASQAGQMN